MDRKRTTSRGKTDASPCKWFLISAKRLGKKNKIKCINHFGDALKLNTHSSAINRRGQKDWDAVVQWPILNPGSLGFELGHICAFAPLGKLLQFVSYFMWLRFLGFCFRFCLRTRTFLHELLLASADPPKSQRNWNCLQLICILNAIENAALFMARFWAERN